MNRVLIIFVMILAAKFATAHAELKIEGSCRGEFRGEPISFTYFSTFDGCQKKSDAAIAFSSGEAAHLNGIRVIDHGQDKYSFQMMEAGHRKSAFWLVFADTTGKDEGVFRYRDSSGTMRSVLLACKTYDYEYSECP